MRGCPPSRAHKRPFGRERVSGERGLRWVGGRIKPSLYSGVGGDMGLVSTAGAVGTPPGRRTHCLCSSLLLWSRPKPTPSVKVLFTRAHTSPSRNSSSSYQHYSFAVIHWLTSSLVLLSVHFFLILFVYADFFLHQFIWLERIKTRLQTSLNLSRNLHSNYLWHR